ncbi:MAG: 3-deoxy-D-manno-octulosonic acid transferase [Calditerrivibrio sp.]|nr:3-deoxy-D-manno-octulosonic acid transferase [Calditerrivibrio sp.]
MFIKGFKNKDYRRRLDERIGFFRYPKSDKKIILIHALSLGEVNASLSLIRGIKSEFTDYDILVTTTTPSGSNQIRKIFSDDILHIYLPFDLYFFMKRFYEKWNIKLGIIIETEIWPNMLYSAREKGIPMILANARMSEKSKKKYKLFKDVISYFLNCFTIIAVRGEADRERFCELGVEETRLVVTGNIKFDMYVDKEIMSDAKKLKTILDNRKVIVAGSTHDGEEKIIIDLIGDFKHILWVVAPRDPFRAKEIGKMAELKGIKYLFRSQIDEYNGEVSLIIVDTFGELMRFYAISEVAFVGGSLVPKGGHNPLEPLSLGIPIISGPYLFNFQELYETMVKEGLVEIVKDQKEFKKALYEILNNNELVKIKKEKGFEFLVKHRGAVNRLIDIAKNITGRKQFS